MHYGHIYILYMYMGLEITLYLRLENAIVRHCFGGVYVLKYEGLFISG